MLSLKVQRRHLKPKPHMAALKPKLMCQIQKTQSKPKTEGRNQGVIGVNRHELEELLTVDSISVSFMNVGGFFISGPLWLAAETVMEQTAFEMTTRLWTYSIIMFYGLVFFVGGFVLHDLGRKKLKGIFGEVRKQNS